MRKHIWVDLLLYPTHTLPIAAAPVMVGAALAARDHVFAPVAVVLAFLGSWLIHLAGLFADTHELLRRHPQAVEHPDLTNALQDGSLTLGQIKVAIAACLLLAAPIAACFLVVGGVPVLVLGVLGLIASFGYSSGPLPYTRLGIAEPLFFVMFGIVAVAGTYFAQIAWLAAAASEPVPSLADLPPAAFFVGLPVGALVTNILLIDDLEDRHFDASKGWRTLAVSFGPTGSRLRRCGGAHEKLRQRASLAATKDKAQLTPAVLADAAKAKDGRLQLALGQALIGHGDAVAGLALMKQGLDRGVAKQADDARLHYGAALVQAGQREQALAVLKSVQGEDGTADLARLWRLVRP